MDKKSRNTIIVSIVALAIVLITVTYAYFSARITGIESASTISLTAGTMGIVYTEGNENVTLNNIYPREEAWVTKTFTLTGYNTTATNMTYDLGLNIITNTFPDDYLTYDLTMVSSTNGTPIATKTGYVINGTGTLRFGTGTFTNADGDTHNYELKIYFKDSGEDQNDAQEAIFNANITVTERGGLTPVNNFVYNGTVQNGTSIVNTQFEYRYNQEGCFDTNCLTSSSRNKGQIRLLYVWVPPHYGWQETTDNGWGIRLRDIESTDPITEKIYTSINNIPITSMALMFSDSQAASIDLTSFDTSNVTNMIGMFSGIAATTLDVSSFDTSNVTSMTSMFQNCFAINLDLGGFNTSHVTNMSGMFSGSAATTLDLSSFDTSNVLNMSDMFYNSSATTLDLSSFDTSNVTDMANMFSNCATTTLDLSSFDISSVEDMIGMLLSHNLESVYARNATEAARYCEVAYETTTVYVGNTEICSGVESALE